MTAAFAFGRDRRLRRRSDFVRVQSIGRRVTTPHFVLLLSAQPASVSSAASVSPSDVAGGSALAPPRLGLVVSRKVGNAVQRARIKRLCRDCFRTSPGLVPAGVDLVVIARSGADGLSRDEVLREWRGVERQIAKRAAEALARGAGEPHVAAIKRR